MTAHPVVAALATERRRRAATAPGWTQADLAKKIGCDPATISNCENGRRSPGFALLTAWAAALDRQLVAVPALCDET